MKSLPLFLKINAVREVVEQGQPLLNISRKYGCSRQSLYQWVKTYQSEVLAAKLSGDKKFSPDKLFSPKYKKGASHPKSLHRGLEKKIQDICFKNPDLSVRGIVKALAKQNCKVSVHGVYNVLRRKGLGTFELRKKYASTRIVGGTTVAPKISPLQRAKIVEEFLIDKKSISEVCRLWKISRPTFYKWLERYQTAIKDKQLPVFEAMARRYKKGYENPRSTTQAVRETVLGLVAKSPELSAHRLYEQVARAVGRVVGHHGIQNILSREGLSTLAKRLLFSTGFSAGQQVQVAPLYIPEVPIYSFKMFVSYASFLIRQSIVHPKSGALKTGLVFGTPVVAFVLWMRMIFGTNGMSPVGLMFASLALFFGFFFFIYSIKYYASIVMILKLAQGGAMSGGSLELSEGGSQ